MYLHRRLIGKRVDKSEAVKTYSSGPKAEFWIILALIGIGHNTVTLNEVLSVGEIMSYPVVKKIS